MFVILVNLELKYVLQAPLHYLQAPTHYLHNTLGTGIKRYNNAYAVFSIDNSNLTASEFVFVIVVILIYFYVLCAVCEETNYNLL